MRAHVSTASTASTRLESLERPVLGGAHSARMRSQLRAAASTACIFFSRRMRRWGRCDGKRCSDVRRPNLAQRSSRGCLDHYFRCKSAYTMRQTFQLTFSNLWSRIQSPSFFCFFFTQDGRCLCLGCARHHLLPAESGNATAVCCPTSRNIFLGRRHGGPRRQSCCATVVHHRERRLRRCLRTPIYGGCGGGLRAHSPRRVGDGTVIESALAGRPSRERGVKSPSLGPSSIGAARRSTRQAGG